MRAILMNASGSSPLTRGKQRSPRDEIPWRGLIPAHAGKTCSSLMIVIGFPAHPRSRGENQDENIINLSKQGSSPLTRGKPGILRRNYRRHGLIPAHAGKTLSLRAWPRLCAAHPRSRGENWFADAARGVSEGSSPLTRGKPLKGWVREADNGLIPAHAGKTMASISAAV